MTILFHVTPSANVESIRMNGLIPAQNTNGLTSSIAVQYDSWRRKHVWLTHDPYYIISIHGGKWWCDEAIPAVIIVDTYGLDLVRPDEYLYSGYGYFNKDKENVEFLYSGIIDPDRIIDIDYNYRDYLEDRF